MKHYIIIREGTKCWGEFEYSSLIMDKLHELFVLTLIRVGNFNDEYTEAIYQILERKGGNENDVKIFINKQTKKGTV